MPTLNWIGKEAVAEHHKDVPFHLLRCDPDLSVGELESGNLLIQGDNLLALKALLPYYAGKVKLIYIDPPYNTGNEGWVYNDNVNSPEIKDWLGKVVGSEAEDLSRHDKWLCMMYPRLVLLKDFLRDDGAIFISIDNEEIANLRLLMDEIFGASNFIETITWNKRIPKNDAGIGNIHEYVLIYRKSSQWKYEFTMPKQGLEKVYELLDKLKKNKTPIPEAETILRELYKAEGYDRGITLYNSLDYEYRAWGKINLSWPNANTFGPRYEVPHPRTGMPTKIPERGWRWKEETFKEYLGDGKVEELHDGSFMVGRLWFAQDESTQPSSIKYLDEVNRILLRSILSLKSDGGIELERVFSEKAKFAYPKPTNLLQLLIDSIELETGDIVLDSFAGSGTTGSAVLQQNKKDGVQRKFIIIEMEQDVAENITAQRLKKEIEGYTWKKRKSTTEVEGLGGGFRFCTLDDPLFDAAGQIRENVSFEELARHVFFTETGEPLPARPSQKPDFSKKSGFSSPLIGTSQGQAIYLLFNGILGDKSETGGNVLTRQILASLPAYAGPKVIYGEGCLLSPSTLQEMGITFRQLPYEVKVN